MKLLTIDPGRDTGWALYASIGSVAAFEAERYAQPTLIGCGILHPDTFDSLPRVAGTPDAVLIEKPRAYPGQKVPPDDLITLAMRAERAAGYFPHRIVQYVFPQDWKGQLPKEVCHRRARKAMTAAELAIVKTKDHNVWDAIALGLWRLGRAFR